jgi:hypothetical protein
MFRLGYLSVLLVALLLLAGCAQPAKVQLGDESQLPDFVVSAAPRVREAYRFAMTNHEALAVVPCYCGCGGMGHTSNLGCFLQQTGEDGGPVIFDEHAAGCGICVDIAQDVLRMTAEQKPLWEIRSYVDATYSSFGPATDTPLPAQQ